MSALDSAKQLPDQAKEVTVNHNATLSNIDRVALLSDSHQNRQTGKTPEPKEIDFNTPITAGSLGSRLDKKPSVESNRSDIPKGEASSGQPITEAGFHPSPVGRPEKIATQSAILLDRDSGPKVLNKTEDPSIEEKRDASGHVVAATQRRNNGEIYSQAIRDGKVTSESTSRPGGYFKSTIFTANGATQSQAEIVPGESVETFTGKADGGTVYNRIDEKTGVSKTDRYVVGVGSLAITESASEKTVEFFDKKGNQYYQRLDKNSGLIFDEPNKLDYIDELLRRGKKDGPDYDYSQRQGNGGANI